jgi:hypothetical protein
MTRSPAALALDLATDGERNRTSTSCRPSATCKAVSITAKLAPSICIGLSSRSASTEAGMAADVRMALRSAAKLAGAVAAARNVTQPTAEPSFQPEYFDIVIPLQILEKLARSAERCVEQAVFP